MEVTSQVHSEAASQAQLEAASQAQLEAASQAHIRSRYSAHQNSPFRSTHLQWPRRTANVSQNSVMTTIMPGCVAGLVTHRRNGWVEGGEGLENKDGFGAQQDRE